MPVEPSFEDSAATTTGSLRSDGCVLPTGMAASSSSSGSHVLSSGVAEELSEGRSVMNGRSVGNDLNDAGYEADNENVRVSVPTVPRTCWDAQTDMVASVMSSIVDSILSSRTEFGLFANRFLRGPPIEQSGRIRDIFPLPRVSQVRLLVDTSLGMST